MKKYKLPIAFQVHVDSDPGLQQLKQDGEEHNRPESEFFKAALAYVLDTRRNLFIELGRYLEKFGPLEPIDYDTGATIKIPKAEEAVSENNLNLLPKPKDDNGKRFSKSYE
jgi:hypothetical protein